jgi:hypothetical protein
MARSRNNESEAKVLRGIAALRDEPAAVLSAPARDRILRDTIERTSQPAAALAPLFAPRRWIVAAGVLPVMLAGALVALVDRSSVPSGTDRPMVQAMKVDGQVVFTIANGSRTHRVYRSTTPDRFDLSAPVDVTDGVYRDGIDRGENLVFYRID